MTSDTIATVHMKKLITLVMYSSTSTITFLHTRVRVLKKYSYWSTSTSTRVRLLHLLMAGGQGRSLAYRESNPFINVCPSLLKEGCKLYFSYKHIYATSTHTISRWCVPFICEICENTLQCSFAKAPLHINLYNYNHLAQDSHITTGTHDILMYVLPDSVEDGEKIVKTAIDSFGRIGTYLF